MRLTQVSITLPSIWPEPLKRTLYNVRDACRGLDSYEVIVTSPFEPFLEADPEHIVWVREEPGTGKGAGPAHAAAAAIAKGEFITPFCDDHLYSDGGLSLAIQKYVEREQLFHQQPGKASKPFSMGLMHLHPRHIGTNFGCYYPYFPFMRRVYIDQIGWFDPGYQQGFGDSDLAFRVWDAGGRCEYSDFPLICATPDDARKARSLYEQSDMDLFLSRWADKYGQGWKTDNLRDFNVDIDPVVFVQVCADQTCFYNKPDFRDIILAGGWLP